MNKELSKEELLDRIEQTAHNYERDHHGCSRSALRALQEHLKLGDASTLKAATPLAAGVAMRGETCGALLAGLLAVGLATASEQVEDEKAFFDSLAAGFRFCRRFEKEMGSSLCHDIQKARFGRWFDMANPEEYEEFIKAGGYIECPKVVGKASRLAAEFILEQ